MQQWRPSDRRFSKRSLTPLYGPEPRPTPWMSVWLSTPAGCPVASATLTEFRKETERVTFRGGSGSLVTFPVLLQGRGVPTGNGDDRFRNRGTGDTARAGPGRGST